MRKPFPSLLSTLTNSHLSCRILFTNLFSHLSPQNPSPISTLHRLPRPNSHLLLPNPIRLTKCPPIGSIHSLPKIFPSPPSYHSAIEAKPNPEEALESGSTAEEILAAFRTLESALEEDDKRLGMACLKVGEHFDSPSSEDPEKALNFALRALKIFEKRDGGWSVSVAKALRLMGSISCKLKRFDDSLEALNTAEEILGSLGFEDSGDSDIGSVSIAVQDLLANTKIAMGKRREALINLQRSLKLKDSILEPDSRALGASCKDVAEAYTVVLDFREALPLCLKALNIYVIHFGQNSLEVVQVRQLLGVIYVGLEEYEEALKQNELSRRVLEGLGLDTELLQVEIDAANIHIAMGRLDEAINTLKRTIQRTDKESESRAFVFVSIAKALCNQEKFGESRRFLEIACSILEKKESEFPAKVAEAYAEISMLYETMNEFETALSLMTRTLAILKELPQEQHLEGSISARIGWLLLLTKRVSQAVPYLESAVDKLKDCFGPKHFGLGFAFKHLGQAYLEMDQPQLAVEMLVRAKDIINVTFGLHHEDSIDTSQCLANAYGAMGSYSLAMEFQQQVTDAWESHGPSFRDELREAHRLLEQLKKRAQGSPAAVFPANTLPLSLPLQK